jgi:hypothetical protein
MGGRLIRHLFLSIAAVALVAAIGGCGSSSSSSSGSTAGSASSAEGSSSLSKAEFVEQADEICTEGKQKGLEEMSAYAKAHASPGEPKLETLAKALQAAFLPAVQTQVDEIRALGAPQGDEAEVKAILAALEEAVESASKSSPSAGPNFGSNFKHSGELAREYGLNGCAYG